MLLNEILGTQEPLVLMLTHGEALASDINKALESARKSGIQVQQVNVDEHPEFAKHFEVGKHPVIIAYHCGEVISRRSRPWGHDVSAVIDNVKVLQPAAAPAPTEEKAVSAEAPSTPVNVTDKTFMSEVIESELPVVVDFWAAWCGPCRAVAPVLDKLAGEFAGKVKIAKVDVDANPMLSQQFRIQSIPTMMFVKEGKIVGQFAGAAPEGNLRDAIQQLIDLEVPA